MRRYRDSILHSAGDLNAFLGCAHAVVFNARALDDAELRARRAVDEGSVKLCPEEVALTAELVGSLIGQGYIEPDAKSVEHLRLVNTLAWLSAEAGEGM